MPLRVKSGRPALEVQVPRKSLPVADVTGTREDVSKGVPLEVITPSVTRKQGSPITEIVPAKLVTRFSVIEPEVALNTVLPICPTLMVPADDSTHGNRPLVKGTKGNEKREHLHVTVSGPRSSALLTVQKQRAGEKSAQRSPKGKNGYFSVRKPPEPSSEMEPVTTVPVETVIAQAPVAIQEPAVR